jgi:hypothetical protein
LECLDFFESFCIKTKSKDNKSAIAIRSPGIPTALADGQVKRRNLPKAFLQNVTKPKAGRVRPVARSGSGVAPKRKLYPQNLPTNALGLP